MTKWRDLAYGQAAPEAFFDAIMELLGTYASPNFTVLQVNATTLRVPASADNGQVAVSINGKWRYNVANADAVAPAGGAATYTLWVTGSANSFVTGPPESDTTTYAFGLEIRASGTPGAAQSRQIGTVDWNGTAIRGVTLTIATPGDGIQAGCAFVNAGNTLPANYLNCDGAAVSRTTYARLFAAIGTTWGVGDGSTTFNVPNYLGRAVIGAGSAGSGGLTARALGATGGAETVALAVGEMPAHDHGGVTGGTTPTGTISSVTATGTVGSTTDTGAIGSASATGTIANSVSHTHTEGSLASINDFSYGFGGSTNNTGRVSILNTGGGTATVGTFSGAASPVEGTTAAGGIHSHTFTPTAHSHTVTMNAHTHTLTMDAHSHTFTGASHTHTIASQGSGTAHTNMGPWAAANWIVKAA